MLFVQQHSKSIPVPKVYALYHDSTFKENYIVMERVPGQPLLQLWPVLSTAQKEVVAHKLKPLLDELRKLPSPGGYCSIGHRPLQDCIFCSDNDKEED